MSNNIFIRKYLGFPPKPIPFFMTDSSDHRTGEDGITNWTVFQISKAGGTFIQVDGTVSGPSAYGWYVVSLSKKDTDVLGTAIIHIEADGADPTDIIVEIVPYDVFNDGAAVIITLVDIQESITDLSTTLTPPDPMILP
jgi:hypothetical protein